MVVPARGSPLLIKLEYMPGATIVNRCTIRLCAFGRYRDLLTGGYRVFVPAFSGTLGFGDSWSKATIGTQGERNRQLLVDGSDNCGEYAWETDFNCS